MNQNLKYDFKVGDLIRYKNKIDSEIHTGIAVIIKIHCGVINIYWLCHPSNEKRTEQVWAARDVDEFFTRK